MRWIATITLLLLTSVPLLAQGLDVDDLLEAFLADDLNTVAKHLPESLEQAILALSPADRQEIAHRFLIGKSMKQQGLELVRSDSPNALIDIRYAGGPNAEEHQAQVVIERHICDGAESMLRLRITREHGEMRLEIWMRRVEGEWRIYEIAPPGSDTKIAYDSEEYIDKIRNLHAYANEQSAMNSLRIYHAAIETYGEASFDNSPPASLPELASPDGLRASEDGEVNQPWIPEELATPPFENDGYRFHYELLDSGEPPHYVILARPIEFGVSGRKSYYMDETGHIRVTAEDRDASADDNSN